MTTLRSAPSHAPYPAAELVDCTTFGFLADPFLWIYAGFLSVMVALSFAITSVQSVAMQLRWPALAAMAVCGGVYALISGPVRLTVAHAAMALFIAVLGGSAAYSIDPAYSFQRAVSVGMMFFATQVGLFAYCRDPQRIARLTDMLWWMAAALVLLGFVYRGGSVSESGRYEGLHDRATGAGTYAALFLPIVIYQIRYRLTGAARWLGWMVVGMIFYQMLLASARMALLTSCVCALYLWFEYYGSRALWALVAIGLVLPVPLLLDGRNLEKLQAKSEKIVRYESLGDFTGRKDRWIFGLEQFYRQPLLGHGFGASRTLAGLEDPQRFKLTPGDVFNLHSDQIEVLMDVGLVGFTWFFLYWLVIAVAGFRAVSDRGHPYRALALAYLASTFYAFGDTFSHGGFLAAGGGVAAFSWSMIAVLLALDKMPAPAMFGVAPLHDDGAALARPVRRSRADPPTTVRPIPPRPALTREQLRAALPSVRDVLST